MYYYVYHDNPLPGDPLLTPDQPRVHHFIKFHAYVLFRLLHVLHAAQLHVESITEHLVLVL